MSLARRYFFIFILLQSVNSGCSEDTPCTTPTVDVVTSETRASRAEGAIELSAPVSTAYKYAWDNGATTSELSDLQAGEYCVNISEVSNASCLTELCITINETPDLGAQDLNDDATKILMIGNSHTFFNNLPSMLESILGEAKLDGTINIQESTRGGWNLEDHVAADKTLNNIRSNNWDFVILQENATRASVKEAGAETGIYPYALELYEQIVDNNSATKVILYMTHAYLDGLEDCEVYPSSCTNELMQDQIRNNYLQLSQLFESRVAPAGIMWKILVSTNPELELWSDDKIHPSSLGSMVSAATLAAVILNKKLDESSLSDLDISREHQDLIIQAINNSLYEGNPDWKTF